MINSDEISKALEKRADKKTIDGLFYHCCEAIQYIQLCEALQLIIDTLKNVLSEKLILLKEIIDSIIDSFIDAYNRFERGIIKEELKWDYTSPKLAIQVIDYYKENMGERYVN